ncbi:PREDICTED: multimerin-2 [Chrysochloris asiatica]|uniref:Multimerin-2 n=1 Tax=Chrysochloris asiatica TaxID=185453 RepID=A0A9B0U4B2_CHRAS|nr:PREDICTED: multimerin-2 [Chrysochloris asiatica]
MILTLLFGLGGALRWGLLGACAQGPGTRFSGPHVPTQPGDWDAEAEEPDGDPNRRNWCPYQKSRLVTFVAACKTEKFLVHSQQPCPQGAPDCQKVKVMYRVASKPVYQVKQKVMNSVAWRCCPGYTGPDCQHHDPTTLQSTDPRDGHQEPWEAPVSSGPGYPLAEISKVVVQQEQQIEDVQNDLHQMAGSLLDLWTSNLTMATTEANQTEFELQGRSLQQVLLPHLEAFLREHFSPIWRGFNESLHSLSQTVRNLSIDVETNRQAIQRVQESTVDRADFQELGAKFESKVQENAQRVGQLRQDMEDRLYAQQLSMHHSLREVEANIDTKLKRFHKAQELPGASGSLVVVPDLGARARPEPESLQARLGQLQRNLSTLHLTAARREEELQSALAALTDIRATLRRQEDEIKELYSESDETFDQIGKVEQQMQELLVNHTGLRELRVILMEKSLIMEETKEEMERHLLDLNLTLQHLQGSHADLIKYVKDCNCQKLYLDLDLIREGQRDTTRVLEETQVNLEERSKLDSPVVRALRAALEDLSLALDKQRTESQQARSDTARLRGQLLQVLHEVAALQAAEELARRDLRQLNSSFEALLTDALRHEAVLAALFGEEMLEEMAEETPGPLPLNYEQIRLGLQEAAIGLHDQAHGWTALAARVSELERARSDWQDRAGPGTEGLEPIHEEPREEGAGPGPRNLAGLKVELRRLGAQVQQAARCCEASGGIALNDSLEGLQTAISTTQQGLERHQLLFHSLFGNFQGLVAANSSINLGKLQVMLSKTRNKKQRDPEAPQTRNKKQAEAWADTPGKYRALATLMEADSPVAFYASCSEGTMALRTVKFNTTHINIGSSYFPEHGYFRAPERGVYLFAVSIEFGPGPGTGQLVFGGHRRTAVYASGEQTDGSMVTAFAMAELQKGERVWFELTQGSVTKRNLPGSAFGGFLIFKT